MAFIGWYGGTRRAIRRHLSVAASYHPKIITVASLLVTSGRRHPGWPQLKVHPLPALSDLNREKDAPATGARFIRSVW